MKATQGIAPQKSEIASPPKAKALPLVNAPRPAVANSNLAESATAKIMCAAAGVSDSGVAARIIVQMAGLQAGGSDDIDQRLLDALTMLEELKPANAMESLLAVQIVRVHEAAMKFMGLATLEGQTEDGFAANVSRSTKLLRTFNELLTAMQKLKGKPVQQNAPRARKPEEPLHQRTVPGKPNRLLFGNLHQGALGQRSGASLRSRSRGRVASDSSRPTFSLRWGPAASQSDGVEW
jgi:hypothetical protein